MRIAEREGIGGGEGDDEEQMSEPEIWLSFGVEALHPFN